MKKQRSTKRALLLSALALLMCVSMLIGSTFAWFTDSVTSTGNKIQAGNLDLDLYLWTAGNSREITNESAPIFGAGSIAQDNNAETLWEPGKTQVAYLSIKNNGSLDLKYTVAVDVRDADGEQDLYEVMQYAIINDAKYADVTAWDAANGVSVVPGANATQANDVALKAGEEHFFALSIHMLEEAGNEYMNGQVDFDLRVLATQLASEFDSFGNQYDKDAPKLTDKWDGTVDTSWYNDTDTEFTLTTAEQLAGLADLVDDGNTFEGKTIKLESDVDLKYIPEGSTESKSFKPIGSLSENKAFKGTFDGQGHTISNMYQNGWELENGYWDGPRYGMGFFSLVENATVKNVNFDGANMPTEANIIGVVAGGAANCVFENISITGAYLGNHSWYSGGVVGWAEGEVKLINCDIDATSVVSSQWGDFNNANGGLIGGIDPASTIYLKDCDVACVIDSYNDVTSAYEWYSYRSSGMLIGDSGQKDDPDGNNVGNAIAPNVTCENVTVTYGTWANYHYCEFGSASYPFCRVEAGESTGAYGNARVGEYKDANGNKVVDDNHVHNDGEKHNELIVFDQLYGGEGGDRYCTYGAATHPGVTVIYNNK